MVVTAAAAALEILSASLLVRCLEAENNMEALLAVAVAVLETSLASSLVACWVVESSMETRLEDSMATTLAMARAVAASRAALEACSAVR